MSATTAANPRDAAPPSLSQDGLQDSSLEVKAPGAGSSHPVCFRDPPSVDVEAAALRLEIARILVAAPSLPVDMPALGLRLLDVGITKSEIVLTLGRDAVLARLAIEGTRKSNVISLDATSSLASEKTRSESAVGITITPIAEDWKSAERLLVLVAERLQRAITREKWDAAQVVARRLRRLPVGVPLGFYRQMVAGIAEATGLVRTGFNCNQDCALCWQGRDWGRFDAAQVLTWIEDLVSAGARTLIISGGEPTLDPELPRYIARARSLGCSTITLETNAIQFAKPGLAERLRDAGLDSAFVSLHSGDPVTSDAITRAPGTHERTLLGVSALLAAGIEVRLNCVLTQEGLAHLAALPDSIHARFGNHPRLIGLTLSSPTDSFDPADLPRIIPDPVALRSVLPPMIDRAFELGLSINGLHGPCGPPLCAYNADPRVANLAPVFEAVPFRSFLPACDSCHVRPSCFGVRTAQLALYGEACVAPIHAPVDVAMSSRQASTR